MDSNIHFSFIKYKKRYKLKNNLHKPLVKQTTVLVFRILVKGSSHIFSHPSFSLKIRDYSYFKMEGERMTVVAFWWERPFSYPCLRMANIISRSDEGGGGQAGVVRSLPFKQASQQTQMHAI